jgi:hypothetical protein
LSELKKTWRAKTSSGFYLAFKVAGAIILLAVLAKGIRFVEIGSTRQDVALGVGIVLAVSVCLFLSTGQWAKWFVAACGLFSVRSVVAGIIGQTISVPAIEAPRIFLFAAAAIFGVLGGFGFRFLETKPNSLDSLCLVAALIAVVESLSSEMPLRALLVAVFFLLMSFAYHSLVTKAKTSG